MSEVPIAAAPEVDGNEGVVLRQLTIADAQRYFDLIDFDRKHFRDVHEATADKYKTIEDVVDSFTNPDPKHAARVRFGIWADGVMVGSINYEPLNDESVEMGYWVGKEYKGHGYASKAARTLVPYVFGQGWRKIEAWVHVDNGLSQKTLRNAGFTELPNSKPTQMHFELQNPTSHGPMS